MKKLLPKQFRNGIIIAALIEALVLIPIIVYAILYK